MSAEESSPENDTVLQLDPEERELLLATKRLFDIYPISPDTRGAFDLQMIIVGDFVYMTTSGAMTRDQYYEMFERCAGSGDFSMLGIATHQALITGAGQYLSMNPELPDHGNPINPGKNQIRTAIASNTAKIQVIQQMQSEGRPLAVEHIGVPPLREKANIMMKLQENGQMMQDVYEAIDQ